IDHVLVGPPVQHHDGPRQQPGHALHGSAVVRAAWRHRRRRDAVRPAQSKSAGWRRHRSSQLRTRAVANLRRPERDREARQGLDVDGGRAEHPERRSAVWNRRRPHRPAVRRSEPGAQRTPPVAGGAVRVLARGEMASGLRILVSGMLASDPYQGGATWAVLQYVLGLRSLGHDVYVAEPVAKRALRPATARLADSINAKYFHYVVSRFDLASRAALLRQDSRETVGVRYEELVRATRGCD